MASASSYIVCPFPDFNWSIKSLATFGLARQMLIWVQHMKITGRGKVVFIFWVYVKVGNSWKLKCILLLASKWKISAGKKIEKICFKYGLHQNLCNEPQTLQPLKELAWGVSVAVAVGLVTGDMWQGTGGVIQVTGDMWQVKGDMWQMTGDRWQVTGDRWQVTGDRWQGTGDRWQVSGDRWQVTCDKWQVVGDRWQVTGDRWQVTGERGQVTHDTHLFCCCCNF